MSKRRTFMRSSPPPTMRESWRCTARGPASEPESQRHAITDWIYWQHLGVLMNDAVASEAPA